MKCPVCDDVALLMSERQGIEIDYCSKCRGVWLDRGELDKIIERSLAESPARSSSPAAVPTYQNQNQNPQPQQGQAYPQQGQAYPQHGGHYKKKKREGFLGELFDFD